MKRLDEILDAARRLPLDERRELLARLGAVTPVPPAVRRSLLELEGLGAEIWRGVDVDAYVRAERDSWDSGKT